ncbi:hypothetical protein K3495_g8297 [Podosphaera aphanis]|nr:hypothetical protein K3495_g8297 [Podosphaera aphanis]
MHNIGYRTNQLTSCHTSKTVIPYIAWHERSPNLINLRPFGCVSTLLYPIALHPQKWTLNIRNGTSIFDGLRGESIYRLLFLETLQAWESADVGVDEFTYAVVNLDTANAADNPQAYGNVSKQYVPKPIVGRPKGVKQKRVEFNLVEPLSRDVSRDESLNEEAGSNEQLDTRLRARGTSDQRRQEVQRYQPSERDTGVDFSLPNFRKESYDLKRGHGQERKETATLAETQNSGVCQKIPENCTRYTHHKTNQEVFKTGTGRVPILSREKFAFGARVTESANALIIVDNEDSVSSRDPTIASESITIDQAFEDDREGWIAAIIKELKALESTGTFTVLCGNPPTGRKLITSRLVLRYKSATNALERIKKARVVARGFQQEAGLDYSETFASVVRYNTLRIILGIAAVRDLEIDSVHINTAFLNLPLEQETYMELPPFFELLDPAATRRTYFLKLNKSLYGLKQAPHEWFMMVNAFFKKIGLHAGDSDPNMFVGNGVILLLFVDDMLITGSRKSVDETKNIILSHWKGKDLKETKTFVGFEIERDRRNRTIRIHQKSYTIKLLSRLSMLHCNATELPM